MIRQLRTSLLLCSVGWMLGCAALPDTAALIERHSGQQARFANAIGTLSTRKSAEVLAQLKRGSGDIDILDKQVALEQAISDNPLVLGNRVTLLKDGAATYPAMVEAIRNARDHINMESYIIEDDAVGREFADLLIAQQARGVQVNLIYDSVGALQTPAAFFERLRKAGIAVLEFNPVSPLAGNAPWRIHLRDHRKLLIIDGATAFVGGINISSVYASGSSIRRKPEGGSDPPPWRDTDVRIEGPVVADFQRLFLSTWAKQRGAPLVERNYFPPTPARGKDIVRAIGSTPDDPYSQMYLTLISAIGNAERQVFATQAYFVPDPQLIKALLDAAGRGVDVRLVLPSHSDSSLAFHAGRSHFLHLLQGGVRIFEREGQLLHSKTVVIDGVWSTVGSTNLDWRSFLDNDEINAVVLGRDFAQQMLDMFAVDQAASTAVDIEVWKKRSPMLRLKEWSARLLERLL